MRTNTTSPDDDPPSPGRPRAERRHGDATRRWHALLLAIAVITLAVTLAACGGTTKHSATGHAQTSADATVAATHQPVTPNGQPVGKLATPGTPKGEQTVPIQVVATPGTTKRQALALVPVYINGHGPLPFALDTGASRSLIGMTLAHRLGLAVRGSAGTLYGVAGSAQGQNVVIAQWRAGNVKLPTEIVAAMEAPKGQHPQAQPRTVAVVSGPVGLLGSDVLSRYGKIAIDYDKGLLILDPPVK